MSCRAVRLNVRRPPASAPASILTDGWKYAQRQRSGRRRTRAAAVCWSDTLVGEQEISILSHPVPRHLHGCRNGDAVPGHKLVIHPPVSPVSVLRLNDEEFRRRLAERFTCPCISAAPFCPRGIWTEPEVHAGKHIHMCMLEDPIPPHPLRASLLACMHNGK